MIINITKTFNRTTPLHIQSWFLKDFFCSPVYWQLLQVHINYSILNIISNPLCIKQLYLRDHPYTTSAKGLGGRGQKMATFADVQYYLLDAVTSSGILKAKQKLGITFNSDKLGGIDFTNFSKLTMCSA